MGLGVCGDIRNKVAPEMQFIRGGAGLWDFPTRFCVDVQSSKPTGRSPLTEAF